jgi:hypothetical protein
VRARLRNTCKSKRLRGAVCCVCAAPSVSTAQASVSRRGRYDGLRWLFGASWSHASTYRRVRRKADRTDEGDVGGTAGYANLNPRAWAEEEGQA